MFCLKHSVLNKWQIRCFNHNRASAIVLRIVLNQFSVMHCKIVCNNLCKPSIILINYMSSFLTDVFATLGVIDTSLRPSEQTWEQLCSDRYPILVTNNTNSFSMIIWYKTTGSSTAKHEHDDFTESPIKYLMSMC